MYVDSFDFEQRKEFYYKMGKSMIGVEIGLILGKSKGAARVYFFSFLR